MKKNKEKKANVLLVDGMDRQTLILAKAFRKLNCNVTTINGSRLDNGYASRYPNEKILDKTIKDNIEQFKNVMFKQIKTGKYDLVVTSSDDTAELLALNKKELEQYAYIAMVDKNIFYKAYNKNETMKICMENDIPCPKTYFNVDINNIENLNLLYPIVVKPCKSFGAIGYHKVNTLEELKAYLKSLNNINDYVIQEYIPQTDIQYETAIYMDKNHNIKTSLVFSKNRWFPIDGGSSTLNITVNRKDIVESCTKLMKLINWTGAADIDLIQDPRDGKAKIIEINPRVSGSVKITFLAGVNIAKQMLEDALGLEVTKYENYKLDMRLRCIHTDLLWFIKSPNRFKSKPSWFNCRHTHDQIWSITDPLPFFTYSFQALGRYKKEMKKRKH